ncbi:hypothetical protein AK812_SmicGene5806 [Symbiodinium microadriaticum]|uniref:Uncharacterized protein n=1 Tax=Symbiodinium microadriaticum TaxID=2951 RepID=A0A1Q9ESR4_SYMMI|nr:hypothetical protein AK812_SmicGene5806 [Symbiodinium microadriaticum]CAE7643037.1 unnamed protein product [Symbiodinium microadriaticum]
MHRVNRNDDGPSVAAATTAAAIAEQPPRNNDSGTATAAATAATDVAGGAPAWLLPVACAAMGGLAAAAVAKVVAALQGYGQINQQAAVVETVAYIHAKRKQVKAYMDMQGSLVFLDLDVFRGAWCMMPAGVGSKTAMWALQELVRALGADTRSAKMTQQGRLPGSWNIRTGRGCQVKILHSSVSDLDESVMSTCLLPLPKVRVDSNRAIVGRDCSSGAAGSDRSATD